MCVVLPERSLALLQYHVALLFLLLTCCWCVHVGFMNISYWCLSLLWWIFEHTWTTCVIWTCVAIVMWICQFFLSALQLSTIAQDVKSLFHSSSSCKVTSPQWRILRLFRGNRYLDCKIPYHDNQCCFNQYCSFIFLFCSGSCVSVYERQYTGQGHSVFTSLPDIVLV